MAKTASTTKTAKARLPKAPARSASPDQAIVDAILAAYDDDTPRLVYADMLLERGDLRGELIQLQCALARATKDAESAADAAEDPRLAQLAKRERALLREHGGTWLAELQALAKHLSFGFTRGLVESVSAPSSTLVPVAERLLAQAPFLTRFGLTLFEGTIAPFVASPLMDVVRTLTVGGRRVDLRPLLARKKPTPLRVLEIDAARLLRDDFAALVACECLPDLRVLHVTRTQFGKDAPAPLVDLKTPLDALTLVTTNAPEALVEAITKAPGLARLRTLAITNNPIGDDGLAAILASKRLASVEELDLRSNALSVDAIHRLLDASPNGYRRLQLGGNAIDDSVVVRIAQWPAAARLEKLDLGSSDVGDEGIIALARSPYLDKMRSIVLSNARPSAKAAKLLRASPHLAKSRLYVGERFLAKP